MASNETDLGIDRVREGSDTDTDTDTDQPRFDDPVSKDLVQMERSKRARQVVCDEQAKKSADVNRENSHASVVSTSTFMTLAMPGAPPPALTKAQAFAVVKDARSLIDVKLPSASSQLDYKRKADRLWEQVDNYPEMLNSERWCLSLDAYVRRSSSFRANKAACCWRLRCELAEKLAEQDRMQRAGNYDEAWLHRVGWIHELAADLRIVQAHMRDCPPLMEGQQRQASESKKLDLRRIAKEHPDWMARMLWGARRTKYVDPIRVMSLIGCRPEELMTGVEVGWSKPGMFSITIQGAKVGASAGQPWRRIHFPASLLPHAWRQRLSAEGSFVIRVESKNALRKSLHRISAQVLPSLPFATAYVYRHAFATRLRDAGFEAEEVAAFMGHSVAETQTQYGIKAGGRSKKRIKRATGLLVEVPRSVRPMDRSGLEQIQAAKKSRKTKSAPSAR